MSRGMRQSHVTLSVDHGHGLHEVRHQQAVHDEARRVLRAHLPRERITGRQRRVRIWRQQGGEDGGGTVVLPMRCPNAVTLWKAASLVCAVRITSSSFMSCTGLKKCSPTNLSAGA